MPNKQYENKDDEIMAAGEPAVAYRNINAETLTAGEWNPNIPFCGTSEEWWAHFHRIEEGHFTPLDEHEKEFEAWKKDFLWMRT